MKTNCIIVDDEPLALDVLEQYIQRIPELHIVARCNNAIEAREALSRHSIDLVFLDVQMPEVSGLEFIRSLENPPLIIITTAHPDYALEGFNLDVTDYLLKPVSFERFAKSAHKAIEQIELKRNANFRNMEEDGFFFVKADQKLVKLRFDDIFFVEALADYVKIHTNEKRIVTLQTMKKMEEKLPSDQFIRVHRSYIVCIKKIKAVSGNKIEINSDFKIPIGKNYKTSLFNYLITNNMIN
jgi:DNA-binding LytR/AlgR family response regulator